MMGGITGFARARRMAVAKAGVRNSSRALLLLACTASVAGAAGGQAEAPADGHPRAEMQQVFESMLHLVPLAMSEQAWSDPKHDAEIRRWLGLLAQRSQALEAHAEQRDAGFEFLSRSLSANIEEIRVRFELGRLEEARFYLTETTGTCVACHSRLPSARRFPMADRLLDQLDLDALKPHEKIHVLVATRQFEAALAVWEAAINDPSLTPAQIVTRGYFVDYLIIAIRVQREPERARRTLEKFLKRGDVPRYFQRDVKGWIRALEATKSELEAPPKLARVRALVHGELGPRPSPLGKEQMIYDLIASSLLLQLIDQAPAGSEVLPEAYYLLGLVEARSLDSYWVPQAEYHLEMAIRLDPKASFAQDAYAAFEELVVTGYGGASGGDLPTDVSVRMLELRQLVDGEME